MVGEQTQRVDKWVDEWAGMAVDSKGYLGLRLQCWNLQARAGSRRKASDMGGAYVTNTWGVSYMYTTYMVWDIITHPP